GCADDAYGRVGAYPLGHTILVGETGARSTVGQLQGVTHSGQRLTRLTAEAQGFVVLDGWLIGRVFPGSRGNGRRDRRSRRDSCGSLCATGTPASPAPRIHEHPHLPGRQHLASASERAAVQGDGLAVHDQGAVAVDDRVGALVA